MPPLEFEPQARPISLAPAGILGALALVLAGCGVDTASPYFGATTRPPKDLATFYANTTGEPEYLDPGKANDTASTVLIGQIFEGLTSFYPSDMHPVQGVASSYEQSADHRLFRFHLRPDAKWSDGAPVKAGDCEYAWKRVLRRATASRVSLGIFEASANGPCVSASTTQISACGAFTMFSASATKPL